MNIDEAKEILKDYISELRTKNYKELSKYMGSNNPNLFEKVGSSGEHYHIEMYSFIDDKNIKSLRVVLSIFQDALILPWKNNSI